MTPPFDSLDEFANAELDYVVEDDPYGDYAIVKLKHPVRSRLGYVRLNTQEELLSESALLHYPLGNPLKISVHTFDQTDSQSIYLKTFHDSDYSSSGGAYFDSLGRFTAMHLGIELEGDKANVCRSAITLQTFAHDRVIR